MNTHNPTEQPLVPPSDDFVTEIVTETIGTIIVNRLRTHWADNERVRELAKELIALLDIEEESDSGNVFRPNRFTSCRAVDGARMEAILGEMKAITSKTF